MTMHKARIAGLLASTATGTALVGTTAALTGPLANLGGYAVAQIVVGTIGIGGPALSMAISAVGGPMVVGAAIVVGVGYGGYRATKWILA